MRLLIEMMGFTAVFDLLEITKVIWEREERAPGRADFAPSVNADEITEDVFESQEGANLTCFRTDHLLKGNKYFPRLYRGANMRDWNVIITVHEHGFRQACELLEAFGPVNRTDYFNVLTLKVNNTLRFMEVLREEISANPEILSFLARVIPLTQLFDFQKADEFETGAKEIVVSWAQELAGKGFHVRMHRRGFKGRLSGTEEEQFLDGVLLEVLEKAGTPGHITFENPDAIVAVETLGQRAGLSLWTHDDLERYPFLRLD